MSLQPTTPSDSGKDGIAWGTAIVVLVMIIAAIVIGVSVRSNMKSSPFVSGAPAGTSITSTSAAPQSPEHGVAP